MGNIVGIELGFAYKIQIWKAGEGPSTPGAVPISEQIVRNHMTYEGMDYICNCAFASGSTFFQTAYVGLLNGAFSATSNYADTGAKITTGAQSGATNSWTELINFTGGTLRQSLGALTYGTISGAQFQLVGTGSPPSFVGGGGGGSVSGAFLLTGSNAFGPTSPASFYGGGGTPGGPNLISVAVGSPTAYSAGQTISVTPITLTLTSA